jgi:DNA-directed RNA polymerase specialized sigma24 family protein
VDLSELERVYVEGLPAFRRVAAAITGDREAGRDAVQEAFAIAVRKRRSYRAEGTVEAWVWQIVVNSARVSRRRSDRRARVKLDARVGTPPSDSAFVVPLEVLTNRQREVVFLRYFADLSYDEIARILGITDGTVAATLNGAHGALRQAMQEAPA